jgi:hypothetical protein
MKNCWMSCPSQPIAGQKQECSLTLVRAEIAGSSKLRSSIQRSSKRLAVDAAHSLAYDAFAAWRALDVLRTSDLQRLTDEKNRAMDNLSATAER